MDNGNAYAVRNLIVRESPILGASAAGGITTTVSFSVGDHGPFILTYAGGRPNAAQVTQDVTAKVNELRQLAAALAQLNQR